MVIGIDGSRAFVAHKTGTENYSYQLIKNLAEIDRENSYLIYVRPGYFQGEYKFPENFCFKVIPQKYLWTQTGLAFRTFIDKIDLLFVPAHTLPLIRKPGLKTVMTVHDLGAEYLPFKHQLKQALYLRFITKFQLKTATKLIAVSEATREDLIKKVGVSKSRIKVIYEGFNTGLLDYKNDVLVDILRQYNLEKNGYFFFIGSIQPRKNLQRLIMAFKGYTNVFGEKEGAATKLILAGGKGWLSDDIYDLPKKLGIEDKVVFYGRVPDEKLSALFKGAKALVFPSLFEGFGLPILEAFSLKCPVITSNISSMPEVVGDAAVLVNPYKVENILDALIKISVDENLKNDLINKGEKQLVKFSWEKAARETLELFDSLRKK